MRASNLTIHTPRTDIIRPFGVLLLLAVIGLALSACGGSTVPPGTTNTNYGKLNSQDDAKTTRSAAGSTTRPVTSQTVRKNPKISAKPNVAAIPFKPIPTETLKGLSEKDFESKIGAPEMIRAEGDIRVWQYRSEQCSFDAFFVAKAEGETRKLGHMLARMRRGNNTIALQGCLDQVVKLNLGRG